MSLSHRIDKDSFVGHVRRLLHVEPVRLKGAPTRRKGEVDHVRQKLRGAGMVAWAWAPSALRCVLRVGVCVRAHHVSA